METTIRQQVDEWANTALEFKWTVSRGRETYGYNICSLYVNREKVSSCNGGGYDMQGTSFGNWLQDDFQAELLALVKKTGLKNFSQWGLDTKESKDPGRHSSGASKEPFYGATVYTRKGKAEKVSLDGGCGMDSIRKIFEALGYRLEWLIISDRHKNSSFFTIKKV